MVKCHTLEAREVMKSLRDLRSCLYDYVSWGMTCLSVYVVFWRVVRE